MHILTLLLLSLSPLIADDFLSDLDLKPIYCHIGAPIAPGPHRYNTPHPHTLTHTHTHTHVLYSTILYCTVLYCTVLYSTVQYCIPGKDIYHTSHYIHVLAQWHMATDFPN